MSGFGSFKRMPDTQSIRKFLNRQVVMKNGRTAKIGILGAMISAFLGSGALLAVSCCAGPIVFLALGLGWAGLARFQALAPYRWIFFGFTAVFMTIAFYRLYFPRKGCEASDACANSKSLRYQRIALWLSLFLILLMLIFPVLYERYLTR
jgi:mercuric ion transport protein